MGFKDFFITKVEDDVPDVNIPVDIPEVEPAPAVSVNLDEFGHDTLIKDIYGAHDFDPESNIFKVEEVMNNLPKETPKATKKSVTLSMLNSFGVSVETVVNDGNARLDVLDAVMNGVDESCKDFVKDSEAQIEEYKTSIAALEQAIANKKNETKDAHDKIVVEMERVQGLVNFIGGDGK